MAGRYDFRFFHDRDRDDVKVVGTKCGIVDRIYMSTPSTYTKGIKAVISVLGIRLL